MNPLPKSMSGSQRALLFGVIALEFAFAPAIVLADDETAAPTPTTLERVEVTGSRIRRIDAETGLPVQVIRREDIDRSGAQSVEQLLGLITANAGSVGEAQSIGNDARAGFAGASLRGLGSQETLVLLDGRRLANYAFSDQTGGGVDLHAIPLEAIDRIEVLKDGASAIYGSDAIGGVINFILKKDYRGASLTFDRGGSQAGGASDTRATATFGFGDLAVDRFNLFTVVDYQKKGELAARDRDFALGAYRPSENIDSTSSASFPANIPVGRNFRNPAAPACTSFTVFKRGGCYFDYTTIADLLPPTEQASILTRGVLQLTTDQQLYAELLYDRDRVRATLAPTPVTLVSTITGQPVTLPTSSPFYPTGLGLQGDLTDLRYRPLPLGARVSESLSEQARVLLGTRGTIASWDYDGAVAFNESRAINRYLNGYVGSTAIVNALQTGLINPFGDSGPVGDALLASTQTLGVARIASGITRGFDAHASRELFDLPAGPLAVALGIEGRKESLSDITTSVAVDVAGGSNRAPKAGTRSTEGAFGELGVPILKGLDAQLAVREDHFSDFGSTLNPKIALRWQPVRALLVRAAYGRGFRAPALSELFTAQTAAVVAIEDPVRCPVTGADADCGALVTVHQGGNPSLKAERSEETSAGIVFEPNRHFTSSIDFWRVRLTNTILQLTSDYVLSNDSTFEGRAIVRGPADPTTPSLPGPITDLLLFNTNAGATKAHGFDVELAWRSDPTAFGLFDAKLTGTYTQQWKTQLGTPDYVDFRAAYANGFVVPRWQQYLSLGWTWAAFTTSLHETMQTGYSDAHVDAAGNTRHVGNYNVWGGQLAYAGFKNVALAFGVDNLFNRPPPFTNQVDYSQIGYNPAIADPRGRFFYGRLTVRYP